MNAFRPSRRVMPGIIHAPRLAIPASQSATSAHPALLERNRSRKPVRRFGLRGPAARPALAAGKTLICAGRQSQGPVVVPSHVRPPPPDRQHAVRRALQPAAAAGRFSVRGTLYARNDGAQPRRTPAPHPRNCSSGNTLEIGLRRRSVAARRPEVAAAAEQAGSAPGSGQSRSTTAQQGCAATPARSCRAASGDLIGAYTGSIRW